MYKLVIEILSLYQKKMIQYFDLCLLYTKNL